ncbi:uncharacterized protein LOC130817822 [Amaranthus tricolor]|uniref:uncharacterized protein LOC130817822 n=1 Tax=Amaranthus tricolor TaxID=29722 RepID=UPI002585BDDC|nr:uncharacterized protein LOC130817822 [Amaranthus tricolor]
MNENGDFRIGQEFSSLDHLKKNVKAWAISNNRNFRVIESEPSKYVIQCTNAEDIGCEWRMRAVMTATGSFKIVRYKGHNQDCSVHYSDDHPLLTSEFVADLIVDMIRVDPAFKVKSIVNFVKNKYGFVITYKRAWLAKNKAITKVFGDWDKSFEELPRYVQALMQSNPGTVVQWEVQPTMDPTKVMFQRMFWAFGPSIKGFPHCRPLISIDGTHLYGKYRGTLMIGMSIDANSQLFPLAFAVVEGESNDTWSWFLDCIRHYVTKRDGLCVISDRHKGILHAMNRVGKGREEPYALHRFCKRHLASNVHKKFKNIAVKNLFGKASEQTKIRKYNFYMNRLKELNEDAYKYLVDGSIPERQWTLIHDGGHRYGVRTTNMSEAFNGVMKGARSLPITSLVRMTFYRVNEYFATRRDLGRSRLDSGHVYAKKPSDTIDKNAEKARFHDVRIYDTVRGIFEVTTGCGNRIAGKGGKSYMVDLTATSCTCQKPTIFKLPCSHVLAVCRARNISYDAFVDPSFRTTKYVSTYKKSFMPVPDMFTSDPWNGPTVVPHPSTKRAKGCPRSTRIRNEMDAPLKRPRNSCTFCGCSGHNKKTCPRRSTNDHGDAGPSSRG